MEQVEIDRCPLCHGTWLDSGEFQAILDLKVKMTRPSTSERVANGVMTVADPLVTEVLFQAISHAGEFSKDAAGAIAETVGEILGGLFSSL